MKLLVCNLMLCCSISSAGTIHSLLDLTFSPSSTTASQIFGSKPTSGKSASQGTFVNPAQGTVASQNSNSPVGGGSGSGAGVLLNNGGVYSSLFSIGSKSNQSNSNGSSTVKSANNSLQGGGYSASGGGLGSGGGFANMVGSSGQLKTSSSQSSAGHSGKSSTGAFGASGLGQGGSGSSCEPGLATGAFMYSGGMASLLGAMGCGTNAFASNNNNKSLSSSGKYGSNKIGAFFGGTTTSFGAGIFSGTSTLCKNPRKPCYNPYVPPVSSSPILDPIVSTPTSSGLILNPTMTIVEPPLTRAITSPPLLPVVLAAPTADPPVPEPGTWSLLLAGGCCVFILRRKVMGRPTP